jgi:hypothetical protein
MMRFRAAALFGFWRATPSLTAEARLPFSRFDQRPEFGDFHMTKTVQLTIKTAMKAFLVISLAILSSGCSTPSKFAHDPRAAVVGPDYLDYISQHPRDRDTQFYYPLFALSGVTNWVDSYQHPSTSSPASGIEALEIEVPEPTQEVRAITGKGWHELEHAGIPF